MDRFRENMTAAWRQFATAVVVAACFAECLAAQEIGPLAGKDYPTGQPSRSLEQSYFPRGEPGFLTRGFWGRQCCEANCPDAECMRELQRCCGDCCPGWDTYAVFDVLFLQRNNAIGNRPLVYDDRLQPVMTTQDLQPATATGTRLLFGQLVTDRWGWEVGYTGIYGMFGDAVVTGPGNLQLPPDLSTVVEPFGDADQVRGTYWSTLNMAEFNLFRYRCCRECGPTRLACTNCQPNCHCINLLAGFVWAGLNEQSALTADCCDFTETSVYSVRTATNYFGPQIGMRGRREWCRWAVEGWWKTALCGTSSLQAQAPIYDPVTQLEERGENRSTGAGVGFIGSLNGTLIYRLTDIWGIRAGYNMYWLTNAAFAPTQWDFSTASNAGTTINDNGTLFLHGANLGVEARW